MSWKTSPGTNNKETNCYNKQTAPTTVRTNLFSSGAFLFLLCSCLIPSHAILSSGNLKFLLTRLQLLLTRIELLLLALNSFHSPPLTKRGNIRENTAGSCQWLLIVTSATSPATSQFKLLSPFPSSKMITTQAT